MGVAGSRLRRFTECLACKIYLVSPSSPGEFGYYPFLDGDSVCWLLPSCVSGWGGVLGPF